MTTADFKNKYFDVVRQFIKEALLQLPHTPEDEEKIEKIVQAYSRKRNFIGIGTAQNFAAAVIWTYARINFMKEQEGEKWTQKSIANICAVSKNTLSAKASQLMKELKVSIYDQRFCRNEIAQHNPLMHMLVDPQTGLIIPCDGEIPRIFGLPLIKRKEDYYYDAMDHLNLGDPDKAIRSCRKALDIDDHYVEAYLGLALSYYHKDNRKKYEEYVNKAFDETKGKFPKWPNALYWNDIENRQYLRVISEKAVISWGAGDLKTAEELYRMLLKLNPNDNQGIRFLLAGMFAGITEGEVDNLFDEGNEKQDWSKLDNLLNKQNAKHKFWIEPAYDEEWDEE